MRQLALYLGCWVKTWLWQIIKQSTSTLSAYHAHCADQAIWDPQYFTCMHVYLGERTYHKWWHLLKSDTSCVTSDHSGSSPQFTQCLNFAFFIIIIFFFFFFFYLPPYAYRATFEYIVYFVIPNKRFIITILGSWGLTAHRGHSLVGNWRGYHELGSCFGVIWGSNLVKTRGWVNSHRCTTSTFILLTMQSCGLRMLNQTSLPSSVCKNTLFALLICMQPKDG